MAHVLDIQFPEQSPSGAPGGDFQRIESSPAMFGAYGAQAEQKLGAGIEKAGTTAIDIATDWQTKQNDLHAVSVKSWFADQTTDMHSKFMNLEGRTALDALPEYKKKMGELRDQAMGQAPSMQEKVKLADSLTNMQDQYWKYWSGHAASQMNVYDKQVASNAIASTSANAVNALVAGDEPTFQRRLQEQDMEVHNLYGAHGFDQDQVAVEAQKRRGATLKTAIETVAAGGDVGKAQALFERYKKDMDPNSVLQVTANLKAGVAKIEGQSIADEVSGRKVVPSEPIANIPSSFTSAIKASEGFDPVAKWDVKQNTVGYGTRAQFAGERITREDAEKRFSTEIGKAAKFVDSVNPNLDPGTRAALTSLTFNAGEDWAGAGLGNAIRGGDLDAARQLFLQYNKAGGETNPGLAARRYREAQWFGGSDAPASAAPMIDKQQAYERVLARTDQNPLVQASAIARLNQVYSIYNQEQISNMGLFDQRRRDNSAEAQFSGQVKVPLTEPEFVDRYGVERGMSEYHDYVSEIQYGADRKAVESMPAAEQQQALARQAPIADQPGYATQLKRYDSLQKSIDDINEVRRNDPAAAVGGNDAIKAAKEKYDPNKPESFRALAAARLAAQEQLGIPEDARSPITKNEALDLTVPLRRMLPGQERAVLTQLAAQFQQMFGPYADQAFEYALHANRLNADTTQSAARVMKKIGMGQTPDRVELRDADHDTEVTAAADAVNAVAPPPQARTALNANPGRVMAQASRDQTGGQTTKPGEQKPTPKPQEQVPDARDIIALRANPKLQARFDQKYGAGKSKKIFEDYPAGVPQH